MSGRSTPRPLQKGKGPLRSHFCSLVPPVSSSSVHIVTSFASPTSVYVYLYMVLHCFVSWRIDLDDTYCNDVPESWEESGPNIFVVDRLFMWIGTFFIFSFREPCHFGLYSCLYPFTYYFPSDWFNLLSPASSTRRKRFLPFRSTDGRLSTSTDLL